MNFGASVLSARVSELGLRFEPVRDAASGEIVGLEARWQLSSGTSMVDANALIRSFYTDYEAGLVDRWALRSALASSAELSGKAGSAPIHVDVRSATQFDGARELYQWLRTLGPKIARLTLEIDERYLVPHHKTLAGFARAVRRLGVAIVIDHVRLLDNLGEALRDMQCDALKVDEMIVAGVCEHKPARKTVAGIAKFAHSFGIYAIAAGVHDRATWEVARDLGCDRIQGLAEGAI